MERTNRHNTSSRIVVAALSIFTLFVLVLILHLSDIRTVFFENAKSALLGHMDTGAALIQNEVERLKEMTSECEVKVLSRSTATSINMVLADEAADNPGYQYSFLDKDSVFYSPTIKITDKQKQERIDEMYSFEYRDNFLCMTETSKRQDGSMGTDWLGIRRVFAEDELIGYIMVSKQADKFFDDEAYDYITDMATCVVINKNGNVLIKEKNYESEMGNTGNFFDDMEQHGNLKTEMISKLNEMRGLLISKDKGSFSVSLGGTKDCFVAFSKIRGTKDIFFVSCFHDKILDSLINTALTRSFLVGLGLFTVIIIILFVTWKKDMDSSALIEKLAFEDDVTGGRNLNFFKNSAYNIILDNRENRFCIYRFDIVRFRYINESYGHNKADFVLAACIDEFRKIYGNKEICVRINSDQFLALVQNDEDVENRYQNYLKAVGDCARENGVKYPIRFRLGIYQVRKEDCDVDIMIDHANVARKSLTGKEKVLEAVYSEQILENMKRINEVESVMHQALNQGEFRIFLQPKWSIEDNCLIGAEALARWIRKDGSMIYPSEFIPIFENNGFIEKMDFYMLEKLCMQMREYQCDSAYKDIRISINQSRILILNPDYVKNVERMLNRYRIPVENLELEITETVFFDEKEKMIEIVNSLKELGIILAMDDFGSGYSSLNILKDVPFDVLKIDREFFGETENSLTSILILEKIIEMAKALGMHVICEGVETQKQVDALLDIGCEWVQGYFYGRPVPIEEFFEKYCRIEE